MAFSSFKRLLRLCPGARPPPPPSKPAVTAELLFTLHHPTLFSISIFLLSSAFLFTFQHPCDYTGPMLIIQENIPTLRSTDTILIAPATILLVCCVTWHIHRLWGLGCGCLWVAIMLPYSCSSAFYTLQKNFHLLIPSQSKVKDNLMLLKSVDAFQSFIEFSAILCNPRERLFKKSKVRLAQEPSL